MSVKKQIFIGLLVTIVGGLTVAFMTNVFHQNKQEPEFKLVRNSTKSIELKKEIQHDSVSEKIDPKPNTSLNEVNTIPTNNDGEWSDKKSLELAYETAKSIYYTKTKDKELIKIIPRALSLKEFDFAIKVAGGIYYTTTKDSSYSLILDSLLENKKYKLARKVTDKIYYTKTKDEAKKNLISALKKNTLKK